MRPTGALPAPKDERDYDFSKSSLLAGATLPLENTVSIVDAHTWRVQGAGSCAAYSVVQAVQDLASVLGEALPLLSGAWVYGGGRILANPPVPKVGLPDNGSYLPYNLKWARDRGLVEESAYRDVPEHVPAVPDKAAWDNGGVAKIGTCHRIPDRFRDRADKKAIKSHLIDALKLAREGKSSAPTCVMLVDDAYDATPEHGVYRAPGGDVWGYHAQLIVAYDATKDAFAVASTWSQRLFWISADFMTSYAGEFWVVENFTRV